MSYKVNDGLGYVPNKYVDENEFISMNMENTPLPEYDSIKDKIPQETCDVCDTYLEDTSNLDSIIDSFFD